MTVRRARQLACLLPLLALAAASADAGPLEGDPMHASPQDLQWFRDAKLGMFLCWGPCSLAEAEIGWSRNGERPGIGPAPGSGVPVEVYDNLYRKFDAPEFDAREWARIAKAAGARYVIFLTRHHDGFSLWDTAYDDYNVMHTPLGRDVTKEVSEAFRAEGIRIFWYYSQPDWRHPDYLTANHERYVQYLFGQVRELLTNYGKIDGIWFDGLGQPAESWRTPELFAMIRSLQPHILINNRAGVPGDFDTPEQTLGSFQLERPWESCITMSTGWSWNGDAAPTKSLAECLHLLIRCAGGGGNLALDVGPMPDGRIAPVQEQRYREMGAWLARYGESVYATTGGPYLPARWGVSTRRGRMIYLHVLDWLGGETLALPALGPRVLGCRALTGGKAVLVERDGSYQVRLARADHDPIDTVLAVELEGSAEALAPVAWADPSLVPVVRASASSEWSDGHTAAMAFDGDTGTRWGGAPESREGWLEADFGAPAAFDAVIVREASWNRVRRYAIEVLSEGAWVSVHEGTTLGDASIDLPPITAQRVRLRVLESVEVPTIWEVEFRRAGG